MNKEHRERLKFYKNSWPNLDPQQLEVAAFYFEMCESLARKLGREFPSAHIFFVDGLEKPGTFSKTSTGHRIMRIEPHHTIDEMRGIVCHELAHQYMEITEMKHRKYHTKKFYEIWWDMAFLAMEKGYDVKMPLG